MSDHPTFSAKPRPPQSGPDGQQRRRRRPPPPVSRESRFIGYLVLGFGILAVVTVLILALSGRDIDTERREADPVAVEKLSQDIVQPPPPPRQAPPQPAPAPRPAPQMVDKDLYFKRQPNINAQYMEGTWQSAIGKYTAILQMQKGSYQIIYAQPDPNSNRLYSLGTYKVTEDMIEFTPRLDWPAPMSRSGAGYEVLTRASFPVIAAFQNNRMLWQNPPQSEKRVLSPYKTPANAGEDAQYIVWQKLK